MTYPRKPLWTEGTFLRQHHLQRLDAWHEESLSQTMRALGTCSWGVLALDLDERALAAGSVHIRRFEALLPGGTLVAAGGEQEDTLPPRPIEGFLPSMRALDVFVGLAHPVAGRPNVDFANDGASNARYTRVETRVLDTNSGVDEQPVDFVRHNLRVLYGHERRELFDVVRVAQLVRSPAGAIVARQDCVPPVVHVAASPFLVDGFRRLVNDATARQYALANARRWRSSTLLDIAAGGAAKFLRLHTLNTYLPRLAHFAASATAQPVEAYLVLADLIGALCSFSPKRHPSEVPPFDHLDLGAVFGPMFDLAAEVLEGGDADKYLSVPLSREQSMFTGRLTFERLLAHDYFLVARGGMPEASLRTELPKHTKIASWETMQAIVSSAVKGAPMELEFNPPGILPLSPGSVVFRIDKSSDHFRTIVAEGTIALYQPLQSERVELTLFAVETGVA